VDTTSELHQPEDRLELYALGRLSGAEVEQIEEHLLMCHSCVGRLEDIGAFALGAREDLTAHAEPPVGSWAAWRLPRFALPAVFATALLALSVYWTGVATRLAPAASLQLTAMRGDMPRVAQARETDLTLTDPPATGAPFRLEVVDASGAGVWSGAGPGAKIHKRLLPGDYFVRLFSSKGQLLHEYGFHVVGQAFRLRFSGLTNAGPETPV
jgi:hypothetical protein